MIKIVLGSKYIKLTVVGVCLFVAVTCLCGESIGKEIVQKELALGQVDACGDYQLVKEDGIYTVRTWDGEILYTAADKDIKLAAKEGYVIDKTEFGKMGVIDFLTGETVFVPGEDDVIEANIGDMWLIQREIPKGNVVSTNVFYVLDENFQLALDGKIFNHAEYTDKYIYGQMLVNEDYFNMQNVANYETFGPHPQIEFCVVDGKGDIVYRSDKYIHDIVDDSVVIQDDNGKYHFVDIYTGEKEAAGNEYR